MRKPITSDRSISSHKPEDKEYLVSVKNHPKLYLMVRKPSSYSWIYRYYHPVTKNINRISLSIYPSISLASACEIRLDYEDLLSRGIDPKEYREQKQVEGINNAKNTFSYFAKEYFLSLQKLQKENTLKRKEGRLNLILDYIGNEPINKISPPHVLEMLEDIQKKSLAKDGSYTDKAERCAGIMSEVFNYAVARGICDSNPAELVKGQLAKYKYGHRPALTKPDGFAKLLRDIDTLKVVPNTLLSLKLLPLLFVRNGDLRRAKWADIDLKKGTWNLKPLKGEGKEKMVREMIIPLPTQAVTLLKNHKAITGRHENVFYSSTAKKHEIISENTANDRLKDLGYQNVHCVHGFCASAKTMLQEQLKYPAVLVEMALGHVTKDQNGTAYARFEFIDDRTEMMQTWADYLDALREGIDTKAFIATKKPDPKVELKELLKQFSKDEILALLQ